MTRGRALLYVGVWKIEGGSCPALNFAAIRPFSYATAQGRRVLHQKGKCNVSHESVPGFLVVLDHLRRAGPGGRERYQDLWTDRSPGLPSGNRSEHHED